MQPHCIVNLTRNKKARTAHDAPAVTVDPGSSAPVEPGSSLSPAAFCRPSSLWEQLGNRSRTCSLDLVTLNMQHWKMAKDLHTEAIDIGLQRRPQDSSQFAPVSVVGVSRLGLRVPRITCYCCSCSHTCSCQNVIVSMRLAAPWRIRRRAQM